jgi:hypothetical protein
MLQFIDRLVLFTKFYVLSFVSSHFGSGFEFLFSIFFDSSSPPDFQPDDLIVSSLELIVEFCGGNIGDLD